MRLKQYLKEGNIKKATMTLYHGVKDPSKLKNIMKMGFDSMELISLTKIIGEKIKVKLPPTIFFKYPNIKELAKYFMQKYKDAFS